MPLVGAMGAGVVGSAVKRAAGDGPAAGADDAPGVTSWFRHQRNAARVLPLPVGAWMSVWWPSAIAVHPRSCAGVGAAKADRNQSLTGDANRSSGSGTAASAEEGDSADRVAGETRRALTG